MRRNRGGDGHRMAMGAAVSLLAAALLAPSAQGQSSRPAPKFAGTSIPDPPQQGKPWRPPLTRLPSFLVEATALVFDQGVGDPRGCEYREVEIGEWNLIKTRGFVLPERPGDAGRFAVCWNGVIYPAFSVGEPVDLDSEIRALGATMRYERDDYELRFRQKKTNRVELMRFNDDQYPIDGIQWGPWEGRDWEVTESHLALKVCLLLRLGRADLAEALFAGATGWRPALFRRELRGNYGISYLTIAQDWAGDLWMRLAAAHGRKDDAVALDAARRLFAFGKAVGARARSMGLSPELRWQPSKEFPFLPFLDPLPKFLADHERRAKEPERGPVPPRRSDPAARIAALIREFDQAESSMNVSGTLIYRQEEIARLIVEEGDAAVGPLLDAIEFDRRLLRGVNTGRTRSVERSPNPASQIARYALSEILEDRRIPGEEIRAQYKTRDDPGAPERWYATLRDGEASGDRWILAAEAIVSRADDGFFDPPRPFDRDDPGLMRGEPMRLRGNPSVSDLIALRAIRLAREESEGNRAGRLALLLARWDPEAAVPALRVVMAAYRDRSSRDLAPERGDGDRLGAFIGRLALARAKAGDREALGEYAGWIRAARPEQVAFSYYAALEPLWIHADHPEIAAAGRALFNAPGSPWMAFVSKNGAFFTRGSGASPLIRIPSFREAACAALADEAELGAIEDGGASKIEYIVMKRPGRSISIRSSDEEGAAHTRRRDHAAQQLSRLDGCPEFEPGWPRERRDEAARACVAFLKKYGDHYSSRTPPDWDAPDFGEGVRLEFPRLDRPATAEDVRSARAIFSLEGQGEVRAVPLPEYPMRARRRVEGKDPGRLGRVWQAEEVRKGGRWERRYGFVGPHEVAEVPAGEIEFVGEGRWGSLAGGIDAGLRPADVPAVGYRVGDPVVVALKLRNRLGEAAIAAPAEFLRRDVGGRPSLRRGVRLVLARVSTERPRPPRTASRAPYEVEPSAMARFGPSDASRRLGPAEEFEAARFPLGEWFDLSEPGTYQLRAIFAAGSGLGEGGSDFCYFTIREREGGASGEARRSARPRDEDS